MVNLSIKEQLIILQERLNSVFQMTKLLKEYYRLSEKLSDTEYGLYFEVMYSYIARYIVLEFYRLCDNDNDCVSIPKLKKEVFENFESVTFGRAIFQKAHNKINIYDSIRDGDKIQDMLRLTI